MDVSMGLKGFRERYQTHRGLICDKWEQYIGAYDAELRALLARGQPVRMLEIGVQNGGSLELWAEALPAGSEVIGIDIDPGCADLALPANARVLIGDATDDVFLQSVLGSETFDLIVDDGSHRSRDIVQSFQLLFPRLRAGGRYFIEDLHASYWSEFGGGFRAPDTAIEFLKSLIDSLHADHLRPDSAIDPTERARLVALNQDVARLSFIDSLVVIEKYPVRKSQPFTRTLAGSKGGEARPEWRDHLIAWSGSLVTFDNAVRVELDAALQSAVAELRGQATAATTRAAALQAQVATAEQAVRDKEASRQLLEDALKAQTEALAGADRRLEEQALAERVLHQSYGVLHQAHDALRKVHDELHRSHDALQQSHDELHRSHDTLQQSHDGLRQSHDALLQSHDVLRQAHQETRLRLKAIKRSWSWRLAWPARRLERFIRRLAER
jgi:SAM-dependent methyltransferase